MLDFEYYYNNVPGKGLCRNNLIYTSLINQDKTIFCQWFYNDSDYHKGMNQVVDPSLMTVKWQREIKFSLQMSEKFPQHVPKILLYSNEEQKIYLEINGVDFWEQANCDISNYSKVLPDWEDQMIEILKAYKDLDIYKYSLHPSSYFVVDGKLKSINHFFCYNKNEELITVRDHLSHISEDRRLELFPKMQAMGIDVDRKTPFEELQILCLESFSNNYPRSFIERAKELYV